jgi:hypothetical protein
MTPEHANEIALMAGVVTAFCGLLIVSIVWELLVY